MIKNYLTAALRNIQKNKFHTLINVVGLSVGIMASLMAMIFVLDETSFDGFHSKADRLYRLNKWRLEEGVVVNNAESSGLYGPGMQEEFPEVESFVRYQPWFNNLMLVYKDRQIEIKEQDVLFVDNAFFEVFDFILRRGDQSNVLTRPSTIVLTPSVANALFGNEDPIGKTVTGVNDLEYEVTGIAEEAPRNSHIQYRALISFSSTTPKVGPLEFEWMNNWHTQTLTTYVLLHEGSNPEDVRKKLADFTAAHIPTRVNDYNFYLQPFKEIYLNSHLVKYHRMAKMGNRQYVIVFSVIAGFILFIACVNYVNINTSKATRRAREVGMRKSLGATKKQLFFQFIGESTVIATLSALLAVGLLYVFIPFFNDLAGKELNMSLLWNWYVVASALFLILLVGFVSGAYPALVISSFKPVDVLKASAKSRVSGHMPRYALITFQFLVAVVMISSTLIVYQQIRYVTHKDLGFDKEHVMVLNLTQAIAEKGETFVNEVKQRQDVVSTSLTRMALGGGSSSTFIQPEGFPPDEIEVRMFPVDHHWDRTYGLKMASGRFFDENLASDSNVVVINEALVNLLQWNSPLEKTIQFQGDALSYPVIGVVKDFNFRSLYLNVEPAVMWITNIKRNLSIRFSGDPSPLISFLEQKWKEFEPRYPFQYYFVDEAFAKAYQADEKLFKTIVTFAGLSVLISCLGLYGLVSYTIAQRTKEFGIRKVLGATVAGLNYMVNRRFILLVILAGIIAIPIVIKLMQQWLAKFAYRIEIEPSVFLLAIGITLVVTVLAVSIQAIKGAMANPVDALRHE